MIPHLGPYERLYAASTSLWHGQVGKLVAAYVAEFAPPAGEGRMLQALDLGAGEGDNAILLASRGFTVDLVEISPSAEAHFRRKTAGLDPAVTQRLTFQREPVGQRPPDAQHDVVIAYGLLHCFPSPAEALRIARYAVGNLGPGGMLVVSCITDGIEPGEAHPELRSCHSPSLGEIEGWFGDLRPLRSEFEVVEETHNGGPAHAHPIFRAIYARPPCGHGGRVT